MKRQAIWWGLVVLLAAPGVLVAGSVLRTAQRLPAPEHVPSETRAEVRARMGRHGETMSNLVRSVVLLDRPTIRGLATRIADEEMIALTDKAIRDKRRLNLPQEFFAEQSSLSAAARALAAAAEAADDAALADQFSALTRTCVGCHSVYLHGRPTPQPPAPKPK